MSLNLAGNPLHEEQLEIVRMLGDVLALNTVINEQRELVFVSFGEIIASHLAAVKFVITGELVVRETGKGPQTRVGRIFTPFVIRPGPLIDPAPLFADV